MARLARGLRQELATMNHRAAKRAAWFIVRILAAMERKLRCLRIQGETLPFDIATWRDACRDIGARYGLTLAGGLEEQEEAVVRAWVQTFVDEVQGIIGRPELRRILMIRPGDRVNDWVHAEARPWARLQALEDAMGSHHGRPSTRSGAPPPPMELDTREDLAPRNPATDLTMEPQEDVRETHDVMAPGVLPHPPVHREADSGRPQGRSAGSGDFGMGMGAGGGPGEAQGSANHRRRWSGIPGGEAAARQRGGFQGASANVPGSTARDPTMAELEESLQHGLNELRPLFRDFDAPTAPDAEPVEIVDQETGGDTQLDDGGALGEQLSGESMDVTGDEEATVAAAANAALQGGSAGVGEVEPHRQERHVATTGHEQDDLNPEL